jgi:hypothetical protein
MNLEEQKDWIKKNWNSLSKRGMLKEALTRYWKNQSGESVSKNQKDIVEIAKDIFQSS